MTKLSEVLVDLAAIKTLTYKPPKKQEIVKPITEPVKGDYKLVKLFNRKEK